VDAACVIGGNQGGVCFFGLEFHGAILQSPVS
jgi:hypothetical protein